MAEKIDELDSAIKDYMTENNLDTLCIAGYRIACNNGELNVEEIPAIDVHQPELFFEEENRD